MLDKYFDQEVVTHLNSLLQSFQNLEDFSQQTLEDTVRKYLEVQGIKFKKLAQPIRIAVTGKSASPGIFETLAVLGKQRVLNRLHNLLATVSLAE